MRAFLILVSIIGLVLTVFPSFFVLYQAITPEFHMQLMFVGMLLWFITAPFWMKTD